MNFFYHSELCLTEEATQACLRSRRGTFTSFKDQYYLRQNDCLIALSETYQEYFIDLTLIEDDPSHHYHDVCDDPRMEFYWRCVTEQIISQTAGVFYLLRSREFCKVGITKDFANRYKKYVTESPFENEILFAVTVPGHEVIENRAKIFFSPKLHRGEWFRLDGGDVRLLQRVIQNCPSVLQPPAPQPFAGVPDISYGPEIRVEDLPF